MVVSMDRWVGKVAIVTGACAGIGAAIAEEFVKHGLIVAGFAVEKEPVEELAEKLSNKKGELHAVKCDVGVEKDILEAFDWVKKNLGPVHILVNNASIVKTTNLTDGDTALWKSVFDTNVLGLCICTREAVKDMKANNVEGHIVHINSLVGHVVPNYPGLNVYPASKHAVTALTETLRHELNHLKLKIKITSVSPGVTVPKHAEAAREGKEAFKGVPCLLQAEDVADTVIYTLSTPPHVQIHDIIVRPASDTF